VTTEDLYGEVILDHYRHPRNFGPLPGAGAEAEGVNPLCGDRFTVRLAMDGERVGAVKFEGTGCAISTASASVMSGAIQGLTRAEALAVFEGFHQVVQGLPPESPVSERLAVFSGVSEFPMRVKCATLPWHTLRAALAGARFATTEGA
jgi:nitrogen fixation protein NifU and related proteins